MFTIKSTQELEKPQEIKGIGKTLSITSFLLLAMVTFKSIVQIINGSDRRREIWADSSHPGEVIPWPPRPVFTNCCMATFLNDCKLAAEAPERYLAHWRTEGGGDHYSSASAKSEPLNRLELLLFIKRQFYSLPKGISVEYCITSSFDIFTEHMVKQKRCDLASLDSVSLGK